MKVIRILAVIILFGVVVLGIKQTVLASGSESIGGYATTSSVTYYFTPRTVTNPSLPGPEVAFLQDWGISGLFLGSTHCGYALDGPIYQQYVGVWQPVMYTSSPRTFCLGTYSNAGTGNFGGNLAWD